MKDAHYPIGRFELRSRPLTHEERQELIRQIEEIPNNLKKAVEGLTSQRLNTSSPAGGWTAQQLAHHIADSNLNGYVRMKWALTEESPLIKTYDQDRWSELQDVSRTPIGISVALMTSLNARWAVLMRSMSDEDFKKTIRHPEMGTMNLDNLLALYAWHGRHHIAQIRALREAS